MSNPFDVQGTEDGGVEVAPPEPAAQPAPPPSPPPAEDLPPRRRRRGVSGGTRAANKGASRMGEAFKPAPPPSVALSDFPNAPAGRDPNSIWTALYGQWLKDGRNPDDIRIAVKRVAISGQKIQPIPIMPQLHGGQLAGDPERNVTPGDQLDEHIELHCHRGSGPATYKVEFVDRHSGVPIRVSQELPLDSYAAIEQRKTEIRERDRQRSMGFVPAPSAGYYRLPSATTPVAAQTGMDPMVAMLMAQNDEMRRALLEQGRAVPPPIAQVHAPVDDEEQFMKRLVRMRQLAEMFHPSPTAAPNAELLAVVTALRTEVADLKARGAVAQAVAGPAPGSLEAVLAGETAKRELEAKVKRAFNLVDRDELEASQNVLKNEQAAPSKVVPMSEYDGEPLRWVPWPGGEGDGPAGWFEWAARMAAENPKRSSAMGMPFFKQLLEIVSTKIPDKLGDAIGAFAKRGGEAAAAAAQMNGSVPAAVWSPQT